MSAFRRAWRAGWCLVLLGGCAHVEAPSGGPEDKAAPELLVTRPDSMQIVPDWDGPVVLVFNERVSERGIRDVVQVSPRTSTVQVDHSGDEIRVRLRGGWRSGTIYHVSVDPGLQDLFGNARKQSAMLVFSTGPAIPDTRVTGVVRDPITGKVVSEVRVEAIRQADSLVYALPSDSAGAFQFLRIPEGEYKLRAYEDQNRNRALDPFERRDSAFAVASLEEAPSVRLGILMPDSTAPLAGSARIVDGLIEVEFDDYLDPAQELTPAQVQILDPEGRPVPVARVAVGELPPVDSATADTAAVDTVGAVAPADTAAVDTIRAVTPADTAAVDTVGAVAPADTVQAPPLPSRKIQIEVAPDVELRAEAEYRVRVQEVRNLLGLTGDAETTFTVPVPAEPQQGAEVAPDSVPAEPEVSGEDRTPNT